MQTTHTYFMSVNALDTFNNDSKTITVPDARKRKT